MFAMLLVVVPNTEKIKSVTMTTTALISVQSIPVKSFDQISLLVETGSVKVKYPSSPRKLR